MFRKAAAALAGLGLIGGTATVAYNKHGDATVRIKEPSGKVQTVVISSAHGKQYSCPAGTHDRLKQYDITAARIKVTLQLVRKSEHALLRRYPSHVAPHAIVVRFKALARRDDRLVAAYNAEIDAHNAIINRDCTAN